MISVIIHESQDNAGMAQLVEHVIGNDEVISSTLITSSKEEAFTERWKPFWIFSLVRPALPPVRSRSAHRLHKNVDAEYGLFREERPFFVPLRKERR